MIKYTLISCLLIFGICQKTSAQFEAKLNPVILLFGGLVASGEYPFNPNFGLEATVIATVDGGGAFLLGKYYLNPRLGADRFNIGAFVGGGFETVGVGFHLGTKIVSKKGVLFEINIGAGRGFGDLEVVPYFKLDIGYRFGKKDFFVEY